MAKQNNTKQKTNRIEPSTLTDLIRRLSPPRRQSSADAAEAGAADADADADY